MTDTKYRPYIYINIVRKIFGFSLVIITSIFHMFLNGAEAYKSFQSDS